MQKRVFIYGLTHHRVCFDYCLPARRGVDDDDDDAGVCMDGIVACLHAWPCVLIMYGFVFPFPQVFFFKKMGRRPMGILCGDYDMHAVYVPPFRGQSS